MGYPLDIQIKWMFLIPLLEVSYKIRLLFLILSKKEESKSYIKGICNRFVL